MSPTSATSTFRALRVRNYRLFFLGQVVSLSGTWVQMVAQGWLVLQLTGSGVALGTTVALQALPVLLFGAWSGVVVDRYDKRRMLVATQASAATLAAVLWALVAGGVVQLWMVNLIAFGWGVVLSVDRVGRQSFVAEMVDRDNLPSAVSLNSILINSARVVGPAIAGGLITVVGLAPCFLINGLTYLAVIAALVCMRPKELFRDAPAPRAPGQFRDGLGYAWRHHEIRTPLMMMLVIGTFAFEFPVVLPLLAQQTFHGGAGTYGLLSAAMSGGAVAGAFGAGSLGRTDGGLMVGAAAAFGVAILATSAAPSLPLAVGALALLGMTGYAFVTFANSFLQLRADPAFRGRVMALWVVAFLGSTPIGGPIVGWVAEATNPRIALALGGIAALGAAATAGASLRRARTKTSEGVEQAVVAGVAGSARGPAGAAVGLDGAVERR